MSEPTEPKGPRFAHVPPKRPDEKPQDGGPKTQEAVPLRCPFCDADPMNVVMRFIPLPPPPQQAQRYVVVSGCGDCRRATGTQLVKKDVVEIQLSILS